MHPSFITLLVFPLLLSIAQAQLDWDYVDKRAAQAREARQQEKRLQEVLAVEEKRDNPKERIAYEKLGTALATHPDMKEVNLVESVALQNFQKAQAGGNSVEISLAQQDLATAKTARFHQAASIPELKQLIDAWQLAALDVTPDPKAEPKAKSNMQAIQTKLGELLKGGSEQTASGTP